MTRDEIQDEIVRKTLDFNGNGILFVTMRTGKTAISIKILKKYSNPKTLVIYPENRIKDSWVTDFEKFNYTNANLVFSSTRSLKKVEDEHFDLIFADEIWKYSERQLESLKKLQETQLQTSRGRIISLTGTLSKDTRNELKKALGWDIIAEYSTEDAIKDGIISDFQINIHTVPLDNQILIKYSKGFKTEKKQFDAISWVIDKQEEQGKDTFFLRLNRMRLLQNSVSKLNKTRELLKLYKDEKVLVFCGTQRLADSLGIPVHHSKSKDNITEFKEGNGHLAVIKIGAMGATYKNLNRVILQSFSSSGEDFQQKMARAMNLDYGQIANIDVIITNQPVEKKWLLSALQGINKNKIKWN